MKLFSILIIAGLIAAGYAFYPQTATYLRNNGLLSTDTRVPAAKDAPEPAADASSAPPPADAAQINPPVPGLDDAATAFVDPATDEIARRIPYPEIRSLEEITANWTTLPENALPENVTLAVDHSFDLGGGNSIKISAGRHVTPVALQSDALVVALGKGSTTTSKIPVENTNLKELVTARYNDGVARIRAEIDSRREAERTRLARAAETPAETKAQAGQIPQSSSDEQAYLEIMRQSVANGELAGQTPDAISSWRFLGYEELDGTGYWTGSAVIQRETYFGTFETEARALIRDGRVVRWIMPES